MPAKRKLVVLSGAGISAESGLKTFRDHDGLWEGHRVEDVATPDGWARNPALVLQFYNERRKAGMNAKPNAGHQVLADLQKDFDVQIITQNVDNLHEKAGSKKVLHLHGEIFKSRSTRNPDLVYDLKGWELNMGDRCELGSQLRPHIVWFHEAVPMIEPAIELSAEADIFVVVGTSLAVYPAASLVYYVAPSVPVYVIDPKIPDVEPRPNWTFIAEKATVGMEILKQKLLAG
ncbi:MAG: NAD-dependent deacylase [Runella slithyformis]|nr:MAG: NAD-dependent deacylase [Runella slithyformis]TAG17838.1 MAG: NAD-dependent deacylase [Cytophagales bacterium]TAG37553.1 MAG: NAD-dependent deacylase [Cytophagia bacterium]TAF78455.1 MAG: NAD-dependent deacylase [Runella slithyformis]TAG74718.1 MAG: NAD-dependent deacylase [Runella slithyformis]